MKLNRQNIASTARHIVSKWWSACSVFFKIMIPVSIVIKLLEESGALSRIGVVLSPLMAPLNLPGEMGIVWATTMLSNIYGGLLSLSSMFPEDGLTVAQMTTLTSLMLFAHTFLIEIPICVKAGCRFLPIFLIRFVSAYLFALLTAQSCAALGVLQEMVATIGVQSDDNTLIEWAIGEVKKYISIAFVVLLLVVVLELLEKIGVLKVLNKLLQPLVRFIGISEEVLPLTIIGMTLGLGYGGGLIVAQSKERPLSKRDIFLSLAFLSLFHSIIEDHLLMMGIGADAFFVFVIRFVFCLAAMLLIRKLYDWFDKSKRRSV